MSETSYCNVSGKETRKVVVDIDDFEIRLNYKIGEDDEDKWLFEQMFEEISCGGEKSLQLSNEGLQMIVNASVCLLQDIYDAQEHSLENANAVDTIPPPAQSVVVSK